MSVKPSGDPADPSAMVSYATGSSGAGPTGTSGMIGYSMGSFGASSTGTSGMVSYLTGSFASHHFGPSGTVTYSMNSAVGYPIGSSSPVVLVNNTAFAAVNVNSSTSGNFTTVANNQAVTPPSYTFATTADQYMKIFSGQCDRVSNYICGQLELVDRLDEDQNEVIVDRIARVIDLMGEPASCTAVFEAHLLKKQSYMFEPLLLAIASSHHKETEAGRVDVLRQYASDPNYRVKRAAVRALGRMETEAARNALRDISTGERGEIANFAAALLR